MFRRDRREHLIQELIDKQFTFSVRKKLIEGFTHIHIFHCPVIHKQTCIQPLSFWVLCGHLSTFKLQSHTLLTLPRHLLTCCLWPVTELCSSLKLPQDSEHNAYSSPPVSAIVCVLAIPSASHSSQLTKRYTITDYERRVR